MLLVIISTDNHPLGQISLDGARFEISDNKFVNVSRIEVPIIRDGLPHYTALGDNLGTTLVRNGTLYGQVFVRSSGSVVFPAGQFELIVPALADRPRLLEEDGLRLPDQSGG